MRRLRLTEIPTGVSIMIGTYFVLGSAWFGFDGVLDWSPILAVGAVLAYGVWLVGSALE